jgi:hypothetical protein
VYADWRFRAPVAFAASYAPKYTNRSAEAYKGKKKKKKKQFHIFEFDTDAPIARWFAVTTTPSRAPAPPTRRRASRAEKS